MSILEIALRKKYSKNKIFCIEEPEIYIHPHRVRYLGSLIKNITSDSKIQVIISTHSPLLVCNFDYDEIIKIGKIERSSKIFQANVIDDYHKTINQETADMYFCDKVLFVEGETEKILFNILSKYTKNGIDIGKKETCDFDRINLSVISMGSVSAIARFIRFAKELNIKYSAILDNDFLQYNKRQIKELFELFSIDESLLDDDKQIMSELKKNNIIINSKGEIEDIFPDIDLASMAKKDVREIKDAKNQSKKTSEVFKKLLDRSKSNYAITIAEYYINGNKQHPLEDAIRNIYNDTIQEINM